MYGFFCRLFETIRNSSLDFQLSDEGLRESLFLPITGLFVLAYAVLYRRLHWTEFWVYLHWQLSIIPLVLFLASAAVIFLAALIGSIL